MRILVVEDDFISRRLLCRYLTPYGECDVAVDGSEAVQAVTQAFDAGSYYDLICLDLMMPGMDGQETLQQIRALEAEREMATEHMARIMVTTALEEEHDTVQAIRGQCDALLSKPIMKQRFLELLRELDLPVKPTPV